ncbi:MAG: AraC family transcriptional regulator [Ginsengibacter sp.]
MFTVEFDHMDYDSIIKNFANTMDANVKNNFFTVPSNIGNGYFRYIDLPNGLQCLIVDFKLAQDMYLSRKPMAEEFYILRFDEFVIKNNLMLKIDDEYIWEARQQRNSVLLTSSLFDFACMASEGTATKSIIVLVTKEWLSNYIDIIDMYEVLKKYLKLKTNNYNFKPFNIEYKTLFNEIMGDSEERDIGSSIIKRRIMILVEKFFNELSQKLNTIKENDKIKISSDEVKRLMEAESYLVKQSCSPAPSICLLSRVAAMSTTTLKTKFKKMYGCTLYEYFQKSRMQRAKVMLLTGKYSIKEIGSQLGYSNLSNFTIAFKKEFNRLPSQLLVNV